METTVKFYINVDMSLVMMREENELWEKFNKWGEEQKLWGPRGTDDKKEYGIVEMVVYEGYAECDGFPLPIKSNGWGHITQEKRRLTIDKPPPMDVFRWLNSRFDLEGEEA